MNRESCTFKYQLRKLGDEYNFFPMLSLELHFKSKITTTRGIIDSGSTATYMPLNIAKTIGLFDKGNASLIPTKSKSISGKFGVYEATINSLKIMHKRTLFDEFRNPIIRILRQNQGIDFMILGRDLVFNRYEVTFSDKRKKVILTKHRKKQD